MTVSIENPLAEAIGNGSTTYFAHAFTVLDAEDLVVELESSGVVTPQTLGVHYTVSGVGSGSGSVTFTTAPASGVIVRRYRRSALSRSIDYQENGDLKAQTLNADFDRIWLAMQEVDSDTARALRVPVGETLPDLPSSTDRASKLLGFDGNGDPVLSAPTSGSAADLALSLATAGVSTGAALVAVKQPLTGALGRTVQAKANEFVFLSDFAGCDPTGATLSDVAFAAALASGAKRIILGVGVFKISVMVDLPTYLTLEGQGYGLFAGVAATRILKVGNIIGVRLNGAAQLKNLSVEGDVGNGNDGIQVLGGRSVVRDVSTFAHGRDGLKVGDYAASAANTNLWRLENIIARANGRHGVYIAHEGSAGAPNCNAGIAVGIEATGNAQHGVYVTDAVDNQLLGICSQSNGGWGVRLGSLAKGNVVLAPYTEANTSGDVELAANSARNYLLGFRGGVNNDGIVDNGTANMVWGRYGSVEDVPLHRSPEAFKALHILEETLSGYWGISKSPSTRNLEIDLASSATADLLVKSSGGGTAGIRVGTGGDTGAIRFIGKRLAVTLNFGSIPTNSTVDQTVSISGADSTMVYTISAVHTIPAGITVDCYWDPGASAVKARASNTTGGAVTVNGTFNIIAMQVA